MREMTAIELEMVIGGYGSSSFDTYSDNGDGTYSSGGFTGNYGGGDGGTVMMSEAAYSANVGQANASGWDTTVTGTYGPNGGSISVSVKHSC